MRPLQAPCAHQGCEPQHQRRPEAAVGQRSQILGVERPQQRRPRRQECRTAQQLQQQAEDKTHALFQVQAQPDDQQAAGRPHTARRLPRQDEQHRKVDQHQPRQQHHRQAAQQPDIVAHHVITCRQQHAANQRQADQRGAEQAAPARAEHHRRIPLGALQAQQEQRAAKQLHPKCAEQEAARLQAQANKQRCQSSQGPGNGGAVGEEEQRCQQIEETQPQHSQHRQASALPIGAVFRFSLVQLVEGEQQGAAEHQRAQR